MQFSHILQVDDTGRPNHARFDRLHQTLATGKKYRITVVILRDRGKRFGDALRPEVVIDFLRALIRSAWAMSLVSTPIGLLKLPETSEAHETLAT